MNKNKSFLEKISDPFKNLTVWYAKLGTWGKILIALLAIIIMGIFTIIMIPTLKIEKTGGLPSLLGQKSSLPSLIKDMELPSLLTKVKAKPVISVDSFICSVIYQYNLTNSTLGRTTCHRYAEFDYDCICFTPIS